MERDNPGQPDPIDYLRLVDAHPDGLLYLHQGRISWVNRAAELLLQVPSDRLVGRMPQEFMEQAVSALVQERYEARHQGHPVPDSYEITVGDEARGRLRLEIAPRVVGPGQHLVVLRKVGTRAQGATLVWELSEVVTRMQRALTVESVLRTAGEGLRKLGLDVFFGRIEQGMLEISHASMDDEVRHSVEAATMRPTEGSRFLVAAVPWIERVIRERRAEFLDHSGKLYEQMAGLLTTGDSRELRESVLAMSNRRGLLAPLMVGGEVWGAGVIHSELLDSSEAAALALFCSQVGSALEVAEAVESLERRNLLLAAVHAMASKGYEHDLEKLTATLLPLVLKATGSDAALLYLRERDSSCYTLTGVQGIGGNLLDYWRSLPEAYVAEEAVAIRAVPSGPGHGLDSAGWLDVMAMGFDEAASVPMRVESRAAGMLLLTRRGQRPYLAADLEAANLLAGQMAIQVENARLHAEAERRVTELSLINEVGEVGQRLEPEQVLEVGVRNLLGITRADNVFVMLLEPDRARLQVAASNIEELQGQFSEREDSNLAWACIAAEKPVEAYPDQGEGEADPVLLHRFGHQRVLAVPLIARGKPIGALAIGDCKSGEPFSRVEIGRALMVASQMAASLSNARLYAHLRESYRKLEQTQEKLVQRERLAAVGGLAAVVAHEVRNPLGVIFNSMATLRRRLARDGEVGMLLDIVEEESERLNRLVGGLLDFTRTSEPEVDVESLVPIITGALECARVAAEAAGVTVELGLEPGLPRVPVDARMVRQALVHLLMNGIQAMPAGGRLLVCASAERAKGEDWIRLEVRDHGTGIPGKVMGRIFDPFFTTRAAGSGLGLAVVRRTMESHQGEVHAASEPGKSTTVVLRFPLLPKKPAEEVSAAPGY